MEQSDSTPSSSSIVPTASAYIDVYDFLKKHSVKKGANQEKLNNTNTRIGDAKLNIYGGTYNIPDIEYPIFMELYYRDIISKNKKEYLTEKQRVDDGALLIDLDFRYHYDVDEKQYSSEHVEDFVMALLEEIKEIYQLDENVEFPVYVLEKPSVNRIKDKKITKDGIHIILAAQVERGIQLYIREKMIDKMKEMWPDLPIINKWEDVYDEGISKGSVNWQLFGSRKPNHEKYNLTRVFDVSFDKDDSEFITKEKLVSQFDIEKNINKLSIRYKNHISLFLKNDFISLYDAFKKEKNIGGTRKSLPINNSVISQRERSDMLINNIPMISSISNAEELELAINAFIDNVSESTSDYELKTIHDYVMVLPEKYYGQGSYDKWIRVGWALKNTSEKLLISWIAFSAKSSSFCFNEIYDLCDRWSNFEVRKDGLSKLSIIHWAKGDAYDEYLKIFNSTVDYYVEQTLSCSNSKYKAPDFDLATVLFQANKHEYICVSNKNNLWYKYRNNRWVESDCGVDLRKEISSSIREMFNQKSIQLMHNISNMQMNNQSILNQQANDDEENEQNDMNKTRSIQCINIIQRLGSTSDKIKIMTEAKELFYDGQFLNKLDTNPYLLCFKNGVIDFKEKIFRKGHPEDYISMCTNIDYIKLTDKHKPIIQEIELFMSQLFPKPELCQYMWEHLASSLIGTSANQTFNQYYGIGQNGKSVLVNLMEKCLGDYKGDVPLTLVTEKRAKVGGLTPEIVKLKGIRYAVMQEPSKDDVINEGILKQMTSGKDPIQGRALHCPPVSFYPQFKLVVTCNVLMSIKSNDHGTWRRQRLVHFMSLFTDNPVDGDVEKPYQYKLDQFIDEKFDIWAPIFMSMLVNIAFEKNGLVNDCDIVMAKTNEYRQSQDYMSEFVKDRIIKDDEGKIKKMELNNEFSIWYMSNYGGKGPSPKDLHEYINKLFGRPKNQAWRGIRIRYEGNEEEEDNENEEDESDISSNDLN